MKLVVNNTPATTGESDVPAAPIPVQKAGAVILLGRQFVVLVRPHDGSTEEWILPKGHLEDGEDPAECASREATEETGSLLHPITSTDLIASTQRDVPATDKWPAETEMVHWFLARAASIRTELITDKGAAGWPRCIGIFPVVVALAKLTFEEHRKVLAQVVAGDQGAADFD